MLSYLDNQVIFPLIQKTILNESIQISLKKNDFTTIIEYVVSIETSYSIKDSYFSLIF